MAYSEQDFLNGLAAGLTATAGEAILPGVNNRMIFLTANTSTPPTTFQTVQEAKERYSYAQFGDEGPGFFISRIYILTDSPATVIYEYGAKDSPIRSVRTLNASEKVQTLNHVWQFPGAIPWGFLNVFSLSSRAGLVTKFRYVARLYTWNDAKVSFRAYFAAYPFYYIYGSFMVPTYREEIIPYPGSPELVKYWNTVNAKGLGKEDEP